MEKSGNSSDVKSYKRVKWFSFSLGAILIFIFFAFYAPQFSDTSLTLDLSNKTIEINTTNLIATDTNPQDYNPNKYYIDSERSFLFEKPESDWHGPQTISGLNEYIDIKNLILNDYMKEIYFQQLNANPYGEMMKNLEGVRFTFGKPLELEITDSTSNDIIESYISGLVDLNQGEFSEQDLINIRRNLVGFEEVIFENEFSIVIYDKNLLKDKPIKQSLANFAINFISHGGMSIDNLVANKTSVLVGLSTDLNDIKIDGKIGDMMIDRLAFLTENEEYFYLVEIGYSAETESSVKIWSQLEKMLNSFTVISQ